MQEIKLAYGHDAVTFVFDNERFEVIAGRAAAERPLTDVEIGSALDAPIESAPLDDLLAAHESVLIVVSDATRATASAQIVNLLVRRLIQIGISPDDISIIFATGIHRSVTAQEKRDLLTPFIIQRIKTVDHDAFDSQQMMVVENNPQGSRVELNRVLVEFSHIILTGAVGFHYFAGFTGGRKSICPGLAAAATIEATHMLALDFSNGRRRTGVGTALLDGNAVHEECERIAALVKPSFGINAVVDERGRAVLVYAGNWRRAHRLACDEYVVNRSVRIPGRRDVVVVSCGGSPYDINLIQAHKALDMAAHACNEGGTIVLLAECPDGLGRPDFMKWFDAENSAALALRLRANYEVNGQTAWSLLSKAELYRVVLVSKLPKAQVARMRMIPAQSFGHALEMLPRKEGYILPRGAALLPLTTS
jgi:nickel-dependent lactate racemase